MKQKKVQLNVYVTPEFAKEIRENAERNHVSLSMYINVAIQTLETIHATGEIPKLTLDRMFREYPPAPEEQIIKWVDKENETEK